MTSEPEVKEEEAPAASSDAEPEAAADTDTVMDEKKVPTPVDTKTAKGANGGPPTPLVKKVRSHCM
jgi:hypothetical protein